MLGKDRKWGFLIASAAFLGVANAQGYFYDSFTCAKSQNFQELGCYSTTSNPFTYDIQNGFVGSDPSRSFAPYNIGGDNINATVTPHYCVAACRAHGFKYAALYNRVCSCGTALGSLTRSTDQSPCYAQPDPNPCPGDAAENCGQPSGGGYARIFVDPSFEPETSLASAGYSTVASSYGYLGCFAKPNLPSDDPQHSSSQADAATCLEQCATYGFPLAYMYYDSGYVSI
ncbi:hypothetical protein F5Y16DRAFT_412949 [Xylariaceae sp. FL0255]|nr:hypothetical protein F5Y16DRAFT_412949 [Xylariaceae sp. FL0255]